jgi:CheY-like chemotaxis protein
MIRSTDHVLLFFERDLRKPVPVGRKSCSTMWGRTRRQLCRPHPPARQTSSLLSRWSAEPFQVFGIVSLHGHEVERMQFLVPPLAVIVEDDQLQRDTLACALAGENIDVIHCSTAAAAELLVSRIGPELRLLVTDLWLSDAPAGAELARFAKERHPDLCVIVVSGDEDVHLPGSVHFLRKPYRPEDVVRATAKLM